MKHAAWVIGLGLLSGCLRPEPVVHRVSLGMSETQLLAAVGQPVRVQEEPQGKRMHFETWGTNLHGKPTYCHRWYVHLTAGKVDAYGDEEETPRA